MLGIVAVILAIGALLVVAGLVLVLNLFGAGDYVIRHLTSRYLGSLAPGFAASQRGFRVYAALILAIGVGFVGVALAGSIVWLGLILIAAGLVAFVAVSVLAIRGEVATYRNLKR